jgi:hypothetical protein
MEPQEPSSQNTWENQHFRAATTIEGTIEAEKPVRPTEPKNRSSQNLGREPTIPSSHRV